MWACDGSAPRGDDLHSSGWKGESSVTIGVGDCPKRPQRPGRLVSESHAEDSAANQDAFSYLSALRLLVEAAEIHIKGYMILH